MNDKPWLTKEYRAYLKSPEWVLQRRWALGRAGHKCQKCEQRNDLEVHHLHYRTLGREEPEDLIVLCKRYHEAEHRRLSYHRRLDAWAEYRYGDDWRYNQDFERVEDEFHRFLDSVEP